MMERGGTLPPLKNHSPHPRHFSPPLWPSQQGDGARSERRTKRQTEYPIQKITEIYNKVTEMYNKITELEISSWNVLSLPRSEVAYIGTEPIIS